MDNNHYPETTRSGVQNHTVTVDETTAYDDRLAKFRRDLPIADNVVVGGTAGYQLEVFPVTCVFAASSLSAPITITHGMRSTPLLVLGQDSTGTRGIIVTSVTPTTVTIQGNNGAVITGSFPFSIVMLSA